MWTPSLRYSCTSKHVSMPSARRLGLTRHCGLQRLCLLWKHFPPLLHLQEKLSLTPLHRQARLSTLPVPASTQSLTMRRLRTFPALTEQSLTLRFSLMTQRFLHLQFTSTGKLCDVGYHNQSSLLELCGQRIPSSQKTPSLPSLKRPWPSPLQLATTASLQRPSTAVNLSAISSLDNLGALAKGSRMDT